MTNKYMPSPTVIAATTVLAIFMLFVVGILKVMQFSNMRMAELEAREAAKMFNVYCVTSSGTVLFNDTVNVANVFESGVYIKRNYYDKDYSTVVTGQCRIDEVARHE
jgi:hypothetical protein